MESLEEYNNRTNIYMVLAIVSLIVALILDFGYNNTLYTIFYVLPVVFYGLDEFKQFRIKRYWRHN